MNGENGKIISDLNLINKEIEDFYCDLLTSKLSQSQQTEFYDNFNTFTCNLETPKLTIEEQISQEYDLSLEELLTTIKSFENNKSPGDDGFTKEFYETFFDPVGKHLLNSYDEAFHNGQLSISQRRGVITLSPKEDSSLLDLSNWRPITLLNVDYKILAKVIAKRIESSLPKLINSDQTGFIKGRYIGQNVRLLNDLMEYTEANHIPGIFLFIDFKKAFDTLELAFINKALEFFNFGPVIRRWISLLYCNVESGVINAGFMTNYSGSQEEYVKAAL